MTVIQKLYSYFKDNAVICTDTRKIVPGCIFFALKGENFNGNTFAADALQMGAALVVVDEIPKTENSNYIIVPDVLSCLQDLARYHRIQLSIPVIGITGSNGKTTTKELASRVLSKKYSVLYTSGNLNNHIGVPLTLLSITDDHEIAIIEMGANHQKEIELLCSIAMPDHVLITNVGKAHLEGFGGIEGVKKGKGEMYLYAKQNNALVFLNNESADLKLMLGDYDKIYRYGTSSSCDIHAKLINEKPHLKIEWSNSKENVLHIVNTTLTGNYNFENVLAAVAIGNYFGVSATLINEAIADYVPDNQRSQEIKIHNKHIIMDAYNANPTSMQAALNNFKDNFEGKKAVFLGDMLELGADSEKEHQIILQLLSGMQIDHKILVGPLFYKFKNNSDAIFCKSAGEAVTVISKLNLDGFTILIKGSRGSKMEQMLDALN